LAKWRWMSGKLSVGGRCACTELTCNRVYRECHLMSCIIIWGNCVNVCLGVSSAGSLPGNLSPLAIAGSPPTQRATREHETASILSETARQRERHLSHAVASYKAATASSAGSSPDAAWTTASAAKPSAPAASPSSSAAAAATGGQPADPSEAVAWRWCCRWLEPPRALRHRQLHDHAVERRHLWPAWPPDALCA
jgi:hypothetical protein